MFYENEEKQWSRQRIDRNFVFEMDELQDGLSEREQEELIETIVTQNLSADSAAQKEWFKGKQKER